MIDMSCKYFADSIHFSENKIKTIGSDSTHMNKAMRARLKKFPFLNKICIVQAFFDCRSLLYSKM